MTSISYRDHAGFTMIEMLVVMSILAVLTIISYPLMSKKFSSARLETTLSEMHDMAREVSLYMGGVETAEIKPSGELVVTRPVLPPPGASQVSQINTLAGTHLPTKNYYGGRYSFIAGANNRVFVETTLPKTQFPVLHDIPNADVTSNASKHTIRVMALSTTGPSSAFHARRAKRLMNKGLPAGAAP